MTSASADSSGEATVRLVENTHTFETDDDGQVWCGGYAVIDDDGNHLPVSDHITTDPTCFVCAVAGTSFRRDALQRDGLRPGAHVVLRPEPDNANDRNAIGVWDPSADAQLGYIPRELSPTLIAQVGPGAALADALGGVVITEFRRGSEVGVRVGLHILVGPVGDLRLAVRSADDDDESPTLKRAVQSFQASNDPAMAAPGTTLVTCPACSTPQRAFAGVGGFQCTACQRDVWIINCRRCRHACVFFGSPAGTGALSFKCEQCHRGNIIEKRQLRAISVQARRMASAETAARRRSAAEAAAEQRTLKARHAESLQQRPCDLTTNCARVSRRSRRSSYGR